MLKTELGGVDKKSIIKKLDKTAKEYYQNGTKLEEYPYTYYHATPEKNLKEIYKNGFKEDTYVWPEKSIAEQYAKSSSEDGEKWTVVSVKSKEKLKADNPKLTDDDRMDHPEYWMLKRESIKPEEIKPSLPKEQIIKNIQEKQIINKSKPTRS